MPFEDDFKNLQFDDGSRPECGARERTSVSQSSKYQVNLCKVLLYRGNRNIGPKAYHSSKPSIASHRSICEKKQDIFVRISNLSGLFVGARVNAGHLLLACFKLQTNLWGETASKCISWSVKISGILGWTLRMETCAAVSSMRLHFTAKISNHMNRLFVEWALLRISMSFLELSMPRSFPSLQGKREKGTAVNYAELLVFGVCFMVVINE